MKEGKGMNNNYLQSTQELIEKLINDVKDKELETYIAKTRIDRIIVRLRKLNEEGYMNENIIEIYNKLDLIYRSSGGGYGGGSYVSNLQNIMDELSKINIELNNNQNK